MDVADKAHEMLTYDCNEISDCADSGEIVFVVVVVVVIVVVFVMLSSREGTDSLSEMTR